MLTKVTLYPSRISCPSIPATMKGVVMSVKGVQSVRVHYEERSLEVLFDDEQTSEEEIVKKIGAETGVAMKKAGDAAQGEQDSCPM